MPKGTGPTRVLRIPPPTPPQRVSVSLVCALGAARDLSGNEGSAEGFTVLPRQGLFLQKEKEQWEADEQRCPNGKGIQQYFFISIIVLFKSLDDVLWALLLFFFFSLLS